MTDRATFLATLRARLASPAPDNLPHPAPHIENVPRAQFATAPAPPLETFRTSVLRSGAILHEGPLESTLSAVVEQHGVRSALVSRDPEVDGASDVLRSLGVTVVDYDGPTRGRDVDIGVVGCRLAIASTGSLVLDACRAGGRTASVLPPVLLAFVDAAGIIPDSATLLRDMERCFPDGPPSQLVLHTGPSRTGDIEGIHTLGVHGPGTVHVCVLGVS